MVHVIILIVVWVAWAWVVRLLMGRPRQEEQLLYLYCRCGEELITSGSFISDTYEEDGNHVRYVCTACGAHSDYDFDHPIPIRRSFEPVRGS